MAVEHPLIVDMTKLKLKPSHEGIQHDERTGWGRAWTEGTREGVRDGKGPDILHEDFVHNRFGLAKTGAIAMAQRRDQTFVPVGARQIVQ